MDNGQINGLAVIDRFELDAALQRDPLDRGINTSTAGFKYNNGFWAHEIASDVSCSGELWVPFMSGYGGISVLLLPNDTVYYVWSDNDTYLWMDAAQESHAIRSLCP